MTDLNMTKAAVGALVFLCGWLLAGFVSRRIEAVASRNFDLHRTMLIRRATFYLILLLSLVTGLNEAGINLSVVVGAAGVASVAVGFASQTSMSNLISGIFIVIEKPFMVGDVIKVGSAGTSGEVVLMGLLSTILKTPDNIMVRIPNETLMKSEIYNTTRFPTRRFDVVLNVAPTTDLDTLKKVLQATSESSDKILKDPKPVVSFREFSPLGGLTVVLSAWAKATDVGDAHYELSTTIKRALDKAQIGLYANRVV